MNEKVKTVSKNMEHALSKVIRVRFKYKKKNMVPFGIMSFLAVLMYLTSRYHFWILPAFCAAYFLIINLKVELNQRLSLLWTALIFCFGAWFSIFCLQHIILERDLYEKTSRNKMYLNMLCVLALYCLIHFIINHTVGAAIATHVLMMVVGFADYFVYEFRQNEITYSDLSTLDTGISVLRSYKLVLHARGAQAILLTILFIAFVRRLKIKYHNQVQPVLAFLCRKLGALFTRKGKEGSGLRRFGEKLTARSEALAGRSGKVLNQIIPRVLDVIVIIAICMFLRGDIATTVSQTWQKKGTYKNGFVLNFILSVRDSFVDVPEGYTLEAVQALEEKYADPAADPDDAARPDPVLEEVEHPTIIVIMNESFSDLGVMGTLKTNTTVTPFIDSLEENTTRGWALASVLGAKTPNSEWEFMTGNSMAFLPSGSVVYQQYIDEKPASIVTTLRNEGYTAVAMHPYYDTGWRRNTVYPKLGFDETYFLEFFDQSKILRKYITDQELYDKIIERFENRAEGEDLFIMSVTMQNHGGYKESFPDFHQAIYQLNGNFPDADQYLSLIHVSDEAVKNLITYFEGVDDPVEIVFFGDHQPSLDSSIYRTINGRGMSGLTMNQLEHFYTVPFFIWTNYDTREEFVEHTSLNFLSTMALERASIDLPPYNRFLRDMMDVIPSINARGYYSETAGSYTHLEYAGGDEAQWLKDYSILQYNDMFDESGRSSLFFPHKEGAGQ